MGKNWRTLFILVFLHMLIDGFIVYFFYSNSIFLFLRDLIPALAFLFFMLQEPFRDWLDRLGQELGIMVVFCMAIFFLVGILEIYNPLSPGLTRGILGLKLLFIPWLVIPLSYAYFENIEVVEKFFKILAVYSIPINVIGLLQYVLGPGFMVSTFGSGFAHNTQMAMITGDYRGESFVRIFGTFASSALYGEFLVYIIIIGFVLLLSGSKPRWLWLLVIGESLFCLLGTGSRGSLVSVVLMILLFSRMLKRARAMVVSGIIFSVILFGAFNLLGPAVRARFEDARNVKIIRSRTVDTTSKMFFILLSKYPLGKGIGSASQASRYLGKREGSFELVENYPCKLQMETGIVGVILFYSMMIFLFIRWMVWKREFYDDTKAYFFFCALSAYFAGSLIVGVFPDTAPASFLFWSCLGMIPRLASFEMEERKKIEELSE